MSKLESIEKPLAFWVPVGVAIGAGIGVAIQNIAVGVGVGVALGAALGAAHQRKRKGGHSAGIKS